MKTNINNAIETEYKGYKFRSRLEARWAVFFDTMNVKWIYEPEGFKMYADEFPLLPDGSYYLPDFYLPDSDTWVEVKGAVHNKDIDKIMKFYRDGNLRNFNIVMVGDIPEDTDDIVSWIYNRYPAADTFINGFTDFPYLPCVCPICGKFGFQFDGRGARICRHDDNDKGYTADDPEIRLAYKIARQARFEHGEKPVTESTANSQSVRYVLDHIKADIQSLVNANLIIHNGNKYRKESDIISIIDSYYSKEPEK